MIDYAQHLIRIEQLTKQASQECLDRKYLEAKSTAIQLVAEARLLSITLEDMYLKEVTGNKK